ncbi:heterokaryon incompatibility protein-domain-containing protein [Dendryphion nanum]|uniref:Heterokaryon incompatibility protein-domain-containing protein n=1 Tax=Dendryphion nanum TaxID=256645 RepID=A0A9P9I8F2_9PLEO|nr:heterokaryon incompatibility protein-domain-containing protein [Dendryphion nanum]
MRLLHFDHARRLISTDFRGKTIPPYAILSHRWGDDEVLFQDLGSDIYKDKDGYRKIEFCAKQAAQDQLQYFWIDTCCINKWDRRELSKAINSMFRWYQNAAKCYVFLWDVSVPTAIETPQLRNWEASFRASDWFKRGWTLQELIAPVSVDFFSCKEQWLGNKISLGLLIHEITRIPLQALQNCPLDKFTIAERKGWAANRETKEEEDNVYCLLGILNVSMPILYNEGKEKAWKRLHDEVEAATSASFILVELEASFFKDKQTTTIAIVGPGGTGKSQLALELAYKTREKSKTISIFWVDAGDMEILHQGYSNIAQKLNLPGWEDDKADVKTLVKQHLSTKGAGQWLLIFDNTDNITVGSGGLPTAHGASVVDYLPKSDLCSIVFTTTNYDTAEGLAPQNTGQQQEAGLLLEELFYLPLAIVQAAAYINSTGVMLQEYRSKLARQEEALERSSESSEGAPQEYGTKRPVATTLLISLDHIRSTSSLAANYLFFAASVDRKDIPLDLLEASSPLEKEDAVRLLSSYTLVTRRPADSALDLHRLVHRALREWLEKEDRLGQWTENAAKRLLHVFPDDNHNSRSKWRRLLPHALYALSNSLTERESEERLGLAWKCALTLYSDGRYNEAGKLFVQVMETRKKVLGDEHPSTLTSMNNLAFTLRALGQRDSAISTMRTCVSLRTQVLGTHHPHTVSSLDTLDTWCIEIVGTTSDT